jgi:hypothetical protein
LKQGWGNMCTCVKIRDKGEQREWKQDNMPTLCALLSLSIHSTNSLS